MSYLPSDSGIRSLSARLSAQGASEGWQRRVLPRGSSLWAAGSPAEALAIVERGRLSARTRAGVTSELGPGDAVGVAAAYFQRGQHDEAVTALSDSELWMLPHAHFLALRGRQSSTYFALLEEALRWQCMRFQTNTMEALRLALMQRADPPSPVAVAPPEEAPGESGPAQESALALALSQQPVLCDAAPAQLAELAGVLRSQTLAHGERLLSSGDLGNELMIIAAGRAQVLFEPVPGQAIPLTILETATVLGIPPFLTGSPRRFSVQAVGRVRIGSLAPAAAASLSLEAQEVLREWLLVMLRLQCTELEGGIAQLRAATGYADFRSLFASTIALNGWRAGAPGRTVSLAQLPSLTPPAPEAPELASSLALIRRSIIGADIALPTPFGLRRLVYADYTASGRSLSFIEDFIQKAVMPLYANTHTEASQCGRQTTSFREEARQVVAKAVGADDDYAVIFVGSGATGAINKLIDILSLRLPPELSDRYQLTAHIPPAERPVVFHGPYEHHSNMLPWRHSIADVVVIPLAEDGGLDLAALERELIRYKDRPLRIGTFSAASNVTGIATDVEAVATLLHRHGALSFWDYAAAGPYIPIAMKPEGEGLAYKDAIFLSPHKFIGGPGSPGVLVVRRELVKNQIPTQPGGGTVDFVTGDDALYTRSIEHREEAGTPAILESIRCGLAFQLKEDVGSHAIHRRESALLHSAIDSWGRNPNIRILGSHTAHRLSIVSFMIRHSARYLHYNFIIALLNDLFGIQARGGCSCAGPYGGALLGVGAVNGDEFLALAAKGYTSLKPGWARVNFNYFISDAELSYIVSAVHMIAAAGFALLPDYTFDPGSGLFSHASFRPRETTRLSALRIADGQAHWESPEQRLPENVLADQLTEARAILEAALGKRPPSLSAQSLAPEFERMRWFPLPHEVALYLRQRNST